MITILLPLEIQHRLGPLNLSGITNQVIHLLSRLVDGSHMTDGSNLIQRIPHDGTIVMELLILLNVNQDISIEWY